MKGAGGTSGGIGSFFIGIVMMCGGIYMLLNAIQVRSQFGLGYRLYSFAAFGGYQLGITSGMVMIPFMFGVGMLFYNGKNIFGWILALGSIVAMVFGVISTVQFTFRAMSAFDLIVILVLSVGGLGLFLRSLRSLDNKSK